MWNREKDSSTCVELSTDKGGHLLNLGERLKAERVRLGYTQGDFGALAGVSKTTQFNYEKGDRAPDAGYLKSIALVGVDLMFILTGERTPFAQDTLNDNEAQIVKMYRTLSEDDKATMRRMAAALSASATKEKNG